MDMTGMNMGMMGIGTLGIIVITVIFLALLVLYYVLLARAILAMLRRRTDLILTTFAFIALIPLPPLLILGIVILIIWAKHEKTLPDQT